MCMCIGDRSVHVHMCVSPTHLECEHVQPVTVWDVTPAVQLHQVLQVTHLRHMHTQGTHMQGADITNTSQNQVSGEGTDEGTNR
jgi:hypothetical protein